MRDDINLCSPGEIRRILDEFGLSPKKGYGQNFLINPEVPEKIADMSCPPGSENSAVLEIGPGIGAMTKKLSGRFSSVTAVEIDRGLIPLLKYTLKECENVKLVNEDFMKLNLGDFISEHFPDKKISVCANLPYYITTPIIMKLLEEVAPCPFEKITVMVQTEVADRMCAVPGKPEYGAITASIAYHGEAKKLFSVSAGNFYPPPKVSSSVVGIDVYKEEKYPSLDRNLVFDVIRYSFGQRRKTLANALSSALAAEGRGIPKSKIEEIIKSLGYRADIRGEKIGISGFRDIADKLHPLLK